jgi:afadin
MNFIWWISDDRQRYNADKPTLGDVLDTLSSAMNLLRRCRVNAALTIQLFSQLFHYVNMWLFNVLVTERRMQFCTRSWGMRLKRGLGRVEAWAKKQGLELAADCHLCRIIQVSHTSSLRNENFNLLVWIKFLNLLLFSSE